MPNLLTLCDRSRCPTGARVTSNDRTHVLSTPCGQVVPCRPPPRHKRWDSTPPVPWRLISPTGYSVAVAAMLAAPDSRGDSGPAVSPAEGVGHAQHHGPYRERPWKLWAISETFSAASPPAFFWPSRSSPDRPPGVTGAQHNRRAACCSTSRPTRSALTGSVTTLALGAITGIGPTSATLAWTAPTDTGRGHEGGQAAAAARRRHAAKFQRTEAHPGLL
jgi:hypothetical protein